MYPNCLCDNCHEDFGIELKETFNTNLWVKGYIEIKCPYCNSLNLVLEIYDYENKDYSYDSELIIKKD